MEFFFRLEDSPLGLLISSTIWGYPIALSLHALGMGVLVGISVMLALRVVGFVDAVPRSAILPYWRLAQVGFVINLLSGSALFLGSASSLAENWAFLTKLTLVGIALFLTYQMVKVCFRTEREVSVKDRLLAIAALGAWTAAIIFGRLIGYIF